MVAADDKQRFVRASCSATTSSRLLTPKDHEA